MRADLNEIGSKLDFEVGDCAQGFTQEVHELTPEAGSKAFRDVKWKYGYFCHW